ncbi:hypothetical protein L2E82_40944 [Cichorium intybus]|uniref:Uncharacterized protein n=1 Tax=Cichorium intybus TaxID=13427 RepID=A0ACB9ANM5_CICIN|nr:hypothetical protein L2E82_40944 [Cichorium intybus]
MRTFRLCLHELTPPEGPKASFPISSTLAQVLADFAIVLYSSGGGRMVVPTGRSTPEMKAINFSSPSSNVVKVGSIMAI